MADNLERLTTALSEAAGVDQAAVADVLDALASAGMVIVVPTGTGGEWITGWHSTAFKRRPVIEAMSRLAHA